MGYRATAQRGASGGGCGAAGDGLRRRRRQAELRRSSGKGGNGATGHDRANPWVLQVRRSAASTLVMLGRADELRSMELVGHGGGELRRRWGMELEQKREQERRGSRSVSSQRLQNASQRARGRVGDGVRSSAISTAERLKTTPWSWCGASGILRVVQEAWATVAELPRNTGRREGVGECGGSWRRFHGRVGRRGRERGRGGDGCEREGGGPGGVRGAVQRHPGEQAERRWWPRARRHRHDSAYLQRLKTTAPASGLGRPAGRAR